MVGTWKRTRITRRSAAAGLAGIAAVLFGGHRASRADLVIAQLNSAHHVTFDAAVPDVLAGPFAGLGLDPLPQPGQLDSDSWAVLGLKDGDSAFGGSHAAGAFARGTSAGQVATGGMYAFGSAVDRWLGIQPTSLDFTPGSVLLRARNATGSTVGRFEVAYDLRYLNDQPRATGIRFGYAIDGGPFVDLAPLAFVTPLGPDASPGWKTVGRSAVIDGLIPDVGRLYLRWLGDDFGGTGARDEIGIDNLSLAFSPLVVSPEPASWVLFSAGVPAFWLASRGSNRKVSTIARSRSANRSARSACTVNVRPTRRPCSSDKW